MPVIRVHGRQKEVCWRSLYAFTVHGCFRRWVIAFVEWKWFERFILFLILVNSILLAAYQHRRSADEGFNWLVDNVLDPVLTGFFTVEFLLKVTAWGFFVDKRSYLRELWNWLDFIVVVTALVSYVPGMQDNGLGFLRLFRILRPLRSLNALPKMKALVNTVISSVPRLANVTIMMFFFFWIFGIIGITILDGIFYHGCRVSPTPVLLELNANSSCWSWPLTGDERLCGGRYMCDDPPDGVAKGFCGGHEEDPNTNMRPVFPGGKRGFPWCEDSKPKRIFPETEFVHFDHMGGALLTVFQCMTMEGWTDIMYYVQDGYGPLVATTYFFTLILITSFFLLNVALAVVDEAREDFEHKEEEHEEEEHAKGVNSDEEPLCSDAEGSAVFVPPKALEPASEYWMDVALVRFLNRVAHNEVFINFVMFFIAANVVTMMLEQYPPLVSLQEFLKACEQTFLVIFTVEMVIMLGALGPKGYVFNPVTCFDGIIVLASLVQEFVSGGGSAFTALRTLRLFRVLNKLASRWPSFRVLLKAMAQTAISLNYWLVLFVLILYIITLMCMSFFKRSFHFDDVDSFASVSADQGEAWCAGSEHESDIAFRQDCIPRAHFDTFLWAFITVFQIMTGENWNWIMYAGMRAEHWLFAALFILIIVFGQILFLSLFLSMLMSKFDKVQDQLEKDQKSRMSHQRSGSSHIKTVMRQLTSRHSGVSSGVLDQAGVAAPLSDPVASVVDVDTQQEKDDLSEAVSSEKESFVAILPGQPDAWAFDSQLHVEVARRSAAQKQEEEEGEVDTEEEVEPPRLPLGVPGEVQPPQSAASKAATPQGDVGLTPEPPGHETSAQAGSHGVGVERELQQQDISQAHVHAEPPHRSPVPVHQEPPREARSPLTWAEGSQAVQVGQPPEPVRKRGWPHGYAFFVLAETNPLRQACRWVLTKHVRIYGSDVAAFDNFILLCILLSTMCMALDFPLRDPAGLGTQVIRTADKVFAIIFIVEMVLKLLALGLVWGRGAYLRSGWNWLDGIVVCISLIGLIGSGSGSFLKTLRILRALRPLRVISRNQNLKIVVQTIFASLPALLTLVIVCVIFLLIVALFAMSHLNGTFYSCQAGETPVVLARLLGSEMPTLPLCLQPNATGPQLHSACPRGQWQESSRRWTQARMGCPAGACAQGSEADFTLEWQRATADTPICVGRCSLGDDGVAPSWLCPRRYEVQEELPPNCGGTPRRVSAELLEQEKVGEAYIASMMRALAMPCGGSTASGTGEATAVSCREVFCPHGVPNTKAESCRSNCEKHPHFCKASCADGETNDCRSCRKECQAACECEEHCEPLIKDAALCVEQGGRWAPSIPQNFDNVWHSFLTLFEISSTEAWVDVMYAACDSTEPYTEPVRDNKEWLFAPFFMLYIFFSFMFLLNLSVGVIVDNFMDLKHANHADGKQIMLTPAQQKWIDSRMALFRRAVLFDLTNLHKLPPLRRKVYEIVSNELFEAIMTCAIVANTLVMASKSFPTPTEWWDDVIGYLDYVFTFVFVVEFALKYYALHKNYWMAPWNCFDFICVVAAVCGIIISVAAPNFAMGATLTQLFRIFRIARLFRLLRSKRLNKIFMALVLSLPKLGNVLMILLLLLVLYSILGVSLFSTVKHSDTLNHHGNFFHFGWAFVTLFRAVTGEAWNSIMHDLLKGEKDFFFEGSWCTPDSFFDTSTEEKFNVMKDKCLIDKPNSCVQTIAGVNFLPWAYWTSYILIICLMVMNLVIAVILEAYAEGTSSPEAEVIDLCILCWRKYDSDQKMTLPLVEAMRFIHEVTSLWQSHQKEGTVPCDASVTFPPFSSDLSRMPMNAINMYDMSLKNGRVDFLEASKQVLRFTCSENDASVMHEITETEQKMDQKAAEKLKRLEVKRSRLLDVQTDNSMDLRSTMAATKLQRYFRKANSACERLPTVKGETPDGLGEAQGALEEETLEGPGEAQQAMAQSELATARTDGSRG